MSESSDFAPEHYFCALTGELMEHPYQHTVTGVSYERKAVLEFIYFGEGGNLGLHPKDFVDNPELEEEIKKWRESNHIEPSETNEHQDGDSDDDEDKDDQLQKEAVGNALKYHEQVSKLPPGLNSISKKVLKAQEERVKAYADQRKIREGKLAPMGPEESSVSNIGCSM
jgi:hypothetical protein